MRCIIVNNRDKSRDNVAKEHWEMPRWTVRFDLNVELNRTELVRLMAQAHALSGVIRDIPIPPYLQEQLDTVNILRAVRGTTAIEGAKVSATEVRQIMDSPKKRVLAPSRNREEKEVRNAQNVMYYIASLVKEQPHHAVTEALICEFHKRMTKDIRYENSAPGKYRSHAVEAGDYLPPESGDEVRRLMRKFVEWFMSPPAINWDPIIRALAGHFYLISIHPFGDGNGRTSRALESFVLYQGKVNVRGFYSLANYYYQRRAEYVDQLNNVRFNGESNLTPFIMFGLKGLVEELQYVHEQVVKEITAISFRDYARDMFFTNGFIGTKPGARSFQFLMSLPVTPTPMDAMYSNPIYKGVGRRQVQRDIQFLRTHELIVVDDSGLRPNLGLMIQFRGIEALESVLPEPPRKRKPSKRETETPATKEQTTSTTSVGPRPSSQLGLFSEDGRTP